MPILACGPSAEQFMGMWSLLVATVLSLCSGIICLCLGSKSLGTCLVGAPVSLFGLFYLWFSLH